MLAPDYSPVPRRIPPLAWRKPVLLWTPLALALAIGGPTVVLTGDEALQRMALVAGFCAFASALITLGLAWVLGRPPRSRRAVVLHIVLSGGATALLAPLVLTKLLEAVIDYSHPGGGENLDASMSLAMTPLAFVLGLPLALFSGIVFAWVAMSPPRREEATLSRHDVQPFR